MAGARCPIVGPIESSTTHTDSNSILIEQCTTVHTMNRMTAALEYSTLANYSVTLDCIAYVPQQLRTAVSSVTYRS